MTAVFVTIISLTAAILLNMRQPFIKSDGEVLGRVSVIIPARNEAYNLPRLLRSFEQADIYECIVVDDGSTDDTAAVAARMGAEVIHFVNQSQWKGKTAACYRGAEAATGDVLLFIDADTFFHDQQAIKRLIGGFKGGLMSVQPYHETKQIYEQCSLYFNLLTVLGLNTTSIFKADNGVFGPCVLCTKADYMMTGGHKSAAHAIIEGFGLADVFKRHHLPLHNYIGKNVIHFRMYPDGIESMTMGWMKHFAAGSAEADKRVLLLIICWMAGAFVPLLIVVYPHHAGMLLSCYLLYAAGLYHMTKELGSFKWWSALCYPIPLLYFMYVFMKSIIATFIKQQVVWKGRTIHLDKRKDDTDEADHD